MIYLNDILIYLNNMSEHHQYVKEVLKYLYKAGFYTKVEKYEFHSKLVKYLGYILSPSSITSHVLTIVATTCWNSTRSMLTLAKLSVDYLVMGITRELDKEPSLYCSSIYINYMQSVLQQY